MRCVRIIAFSNVSAPPSSLHPQLKMCMASVVIKRL